MLSQYLPLEVSYIIGGSDFELWIFSEAHKEDFIRESGDIYGQSSVKTQSNKKTSSNNTFHPFYK